MDGRTLQDDIATLIRFERNQGLDADVTHIVPKSWLVERISEGYIVTGDGAADWDAQVWTVMRFLAYRGFLSVRRSGPLDASEYELISAMDNRIGFRARFRPTDRS